MRRHRKNAGQVFSALFAALTLVCLAVVVVNRVSTHTPTPESRYEEVWTRVNDNFLFEDRLAGWQARKSTPRRFTSMKDAEAEIDSMLSTLNDRYTRYYGPAEKKHRESRRTATNVVTWRMHPDGVGYVKIRTFSSSNTAAEVEQALKALSGARALIIDLRGNGGGLVWQSFRVFALFADQGVFQTASGRKDGKPWTGRYELKAGELLEYEDGSETSRKESPANLTGNKPLTILVDGSTASASEALAGALRHHRGARLVGQTTFGKGIMQTTFELPGGAAIKVTQAYIYQPDGTCVHKLGLKPDVRALPNGSGAGRNDPVLDQALKVDESILAPGN